MARKAASVKTQYMRYTCMHICGGMYIMYICMYLEYAAWQMEVVLMVVVLFVHVGSVLANKACSNNKNNNKRQYNGTSIAVSAHSTHVKRSTTTTNSSTCLPFLRVLCSCCCCCSQCSSSCCCCCCLALS